MPARRIRLAALPIVLPMSSRIEWHSLTGTLLIEAYDGSADSHSININAIDAGGAVLLHSSVD